MSDILFPVGRIVGGCCYKTYPVIDDRTKQPKMTKDGTPQVKCSFGVAIPKKGEPHWGHTPWGAEIWRIGCTAFPRESQVEGFAWKITDGDSVKPNRKGTVPATQEGYPGHWVVWFSNGFLPKTVNANGTAEIPGEAVKTGYWVEVIGSVKSNESNQTAGVFINPAAVALAGYGKEISTGIDTTQVGFGGKPLPVGASAIPLSSVPAMGPPGVAPIPGTPALPAGVPSGLSPNPTIMGMPPIPGAGMPTPAMPGAAAYPPAVPPTPPTPVMTAKANGLPLAEWLKAGWTLDMLRANGIVQ